MHVLQAVDDVEDIVAIAAVAVMNAHGREGYGGTLHTTNACSLRVTERKSNTYLTLGTLDTSLSGHYTRAI